MSVRRRVRLSIQVSALFLVLSLSACEVLNPSKDSPQAPQGWITIEGQRVALEIAQTPEQHSRGLGERDALGWDRGMLFLYDESGFPRFWMKGMRFDIDIVWIHGDRVVDISHRVAHVPGESGPIVAPRNLTDRVLEVPAGYAQSHGWRVGQRVAIELQSVEP
jgi:hypothetical protein